MQSFNFILQGAAVQQLEISAETFAATVIRALVPGALTLILMWYVCEMYWRVLHTADLLPTCTDNVLWNFIETSVYAVRTRASVHVHSASQ